MIEVFSAGDLVSIRKNDGEKTCGIVIYGNRSSMYDSSTPGRSFYVYSVLVDGEVHNVPEDIMKLQK